MLTKTHGIVLKNIKYGESSIITNIFTDQLGLQSYIINSIRSSKKSRFHSALFQPMTLLDLVVYYRQGVDIHRISEVKCKYQYKNLGRNIQKSAITMFLNEFLYKVTRYESDPKVLYNFLEDSMIRLDKLDKGVENFHLYFLIKICKFLGFSPEDSKEFELHAPGESVPFSNKTKEHINHLIKYEYEQALNISNTERRELLNIFVTFFKYEFENLQNIRSLSILKEVFR